METNVPSHDPLARLVHKAVADYVASANGAGVAVGVIRGDKGRLFCFGTLGGQAARPVDAGTLFEIGSITKLMTANLLALLAQEGRVGLDDPVARHLPTEVRVPEAPGGPITLRHLATHTSSLPRLPGDFDQYVTDEANPYAQYTVENLYGSLSKATLKRPVGSRADYSNFGMGLLGHALARVAGCTYEELLRARLLKPLGMDDTAITLSPEQRERLARGHAESGEPVPHWDLPTLEGAGAVRSTIDDMLRYVAAHLGGAPAGVASALETCQKIHHRIPRLPPTVKRVTAGVVCAAASLIVQWAWPVPPGSFAFLVTLVLPFLVSLAGWRFWAGLCCAIITWGGTLALWGDRFGAWVALLIFVVPLLVAWWRAGPSAQRLGWHELALSNGADVLWHNGGTGGFSTFLGIIPEQNLGVVLLSANAKSTDETALGLLQSLAEYEQEQTDDRQP